MTTSYEEEERHLHQTKAALERQLDAGIHYDGMLYDHSQRSIARLQQANYHDIQSVFDNPYVRRIDVQYAGEPIPEMLYFGYRNLRLDGLPGGAIMDWRSSIATLLYESDAPTLSYVHNGHRHNVTIVTKRALFIRNGHLERVEEYGATSTPDDTSVLVYQALNDRSTSLVDDIVATIQPEQHRLIQSSPTTVLFINGSAGSGKTAILHHRMAYLFFSDDEREGLNPAACICFSPSRQMISATQDLVPRLAGVAIRQTVLDAWMLQRVNTLLNKNYRLDDHTLERALTKPFYREAITLKGSLHVIPLLEHIAMMIPQKAPDLVAAIYHILNDQELLRTLNMGILAPNELAQLYRPWPTDQTIIDGVRLPWSRLRRQYRIFREDLALIYYIVLLLAEQSPPQFEHIFLDEAQAMSPLQFHLLTLHATNGSMTIVGDVMQNITPWAGITSWQQLTDQLPATRYQYETLAQNYRSSYEIVQLANHILLTTHHVGNSAAISHHYHPLEAMARHREKPHLTYAPQRALMIDALVNHILVHVETYPSMAIITKNTKHQTQVWDDVRDHAEKRGIRVVNGIESLTRHDLGGVVMVPIQQIKGLEFPVVFILDVDDHWYSFKHWWHGYELYIATTRAFHQLYLYHQRPLSPYLTEAMPYVTSTTTEPQPRIMTRPDTLQGVPYRLDERRQMLDHEHRTFLHDMENTMPRSDWNGQFISAPLKDDYGEESWA